MALQQQLKNQSTTKLLNLSILGTLVLLYAPILLDWTYGWLKKNTISTEHEYFNHGLIGIPYAAYLTWNNRKQWQSLPDTTHPLSFLLLLVGGIFYLSGVTQWVNLSLPAILAALCLGLKGAPGFRLQGFPLLLIFFATPTEVPYLISPYSFPLQIFIANMVGFILNQFSLGVTVYQTNIYFNNRIVEIAPYCAGLKMLFTTFYVCLILLNRKGVLSSRSITAWFLSIAAATNICANIIRNTLLTYFHGTGKETAFNSLHAGWGGELYSACMLVLLLPLLNWLCSYFSDGVEQEREL